MHSTCSEGLIDTSASDHSGLVHVADLFMILRLSYQPLVSFRLKKTAQKTSRVSRVHVRKSICCGAIPMSLLCKDCWKPSLLGAPSRELESTQRQIDAAHQLDSHKCLLPCKP